MVLKQKIPCWKAHPGVCCRTDRGNYSMIMNLAACLRKAAEVGTWYAIDVLGAAAADGDEDEIVITMHVFTGLALSAHIAM